MTYTLDSKIDDANKINRYLSKHSYLLNFNKSDYCLIVSDTHFIYKYQTDNNVWYVHHDPKTNLVFRVCVYSFKE